jgi:hypothetical protein
MELFRRLYQRFGECFCRKRQPGEESLFPENYSSAFSRSYQPGQFYSLACSRFHPPVCMGKAAGFFSGPSSAVDVVRDVEHILQVILFAGFFLTPVIYPYDLVVKTHNQHLLYFLNPMASLIVCYQNVLYKGEFPPSVAFVCVPLVFSIVLLVSGYCFLTKVEAMVIDQL